MSPVPSVNLPDESLEDLSEGGLIRTCHLCGKAQCGQRRGRVRCAYCKRVFCLQHYIKSSRFEQKQMIQSLNVLAVWAFVAVLQIAETASSCSLQSV